MVIHCPNCGASVKIKHCRHAGCHWYKCTCERNLEFRWLVFDAKGRCFLERVKTK